MPKRKENQSSKLHKYVSTYPGIFTTDGRILSCVPCSRSVCHDRKSQVLQHLDGKMHKEAVVRRELTGQFLIQPLISQVPQNDQFNEDLCQFMVSCDIPLDKISNPNFPKFFNKYTSYRVASQTTMRQKILPVLFKSTMESIKKELKNKYIWGSVDETTDSSGRYVANFVVGILSPEEDLSKKKYLLNSGCLERTNHATVAKFVDESLCLLGDDFQKENFLLLVTDAAAYMIKAGKHLSTFYVNMIHLTCLAHGVHRVCEFIRSCFEETDSLISNCKKVFLKAPARVNKFKEFYPLIPLPPKPIITRWGTWLSAAMYYCEYFDEIKTVLEIFDEEDSVAIKKAKKIFDSPKLKPQLTFIQSHFVILPEIIIKLQDSNAPIMKQLFLIENLQNELKKNVDTIGKKVYGKLLSVLAKNPGLEKIKTISSIINGKENNVHDFSPIEIASFKYAPLASVDVERSFSAFKQIYRDNRHGFLFENLKMHLIIQCNSNQI